MNLIPLLPWLVTGSLLALAPKRDWASSTELGERMRRDPAGVVLRQEYGYRRLLFGSYENRDVRVALA